MVEYLKANDIRMDQWATLFGRRCRARLSQEESPAGKDRFGRCELKPHGKDVAHALEYGMYNLRWWTMTTSSN